MRCKACNKLLEETELTRKDKLTGQFLDLCNTCYKVSNETLIEYDSEIPNFNIITGGRHGRKAILRGC
jgi:phage FluMu protein Com